MTEEEFTRLMAKKAASKTAKKPKYNNARVNVDGITFDSKAEAARYEANKLRIKAGDLAFQLLQVPFLRPCAPGDKPKRYLLDFMEVKPDGTADYIDVKGFETKEFKVKRDVVQATYGVKIQCVKK
jgi:hypothetical protein